MLSFKRWRRERVLRRHHIPDSHWADTLEKVPALWGLDTGERARLRALSVLFLHAKIVTGAHGLEVSDAMRVHIAAQACLPILNLDLDFYRGWRTVVVYPDAFLAEVEEHDDAGVVHKGRDLRTGEAWPDGPVLLAGSDVLPHPEYLVNVVIHEFAHKLDMLNGDANGMPPLHGDMDPAGWTHALSTAYEALCRDLDAGVDTAVDPYAAETPGEFFAVVTEYFFEDPWLLREQYPGVYGQLRAFYRQDPAGRAPP